MSEVDIMNAALIKVGEKRITARDEGTVQANACAERYDDLRDLLLRGHEWSFATRRTSLARSIITPDHEFQYQFPLPTDWLRTIKVSSTTLGNTNVVYRMASHPTDLRVLLTDAENLYLTYVAKITDTSLMPADFREALACRLASDLASRLKQSNSLMEMLDRQAEFALMAAKSADDIEDFPVERPAGSWVTSRRQGRNWPQVGW